MKRRGLIALLLALILAVGGLSAAAAEEASDVYRLGDKPADFTVTLSDGQEISLYGLLAEKKVVLLNFWASWCGPCQREFPYLQEVYDQMSDEVGVISLSINDGDTDEIIEAFKGEHGITTLPLGRDIGLKPQYGVTAYPTTVVIDRNGVICLIHEGMLTSAQIITNMLATFTDESYNKSILLEKIPELPVTEAPDAESLSAALNGEGGALEFVSVQNEESLWPFTPSAEGNSAEASNVDVANSMGNVMAQIEAKAGDVLTYDLRMTGAEFADRLVVFIDENSTMLHTASFDWTTCAIRFDEDASHMIAFAYTRGSGSGYDAACELRNVRLLTGDEAAAYEIPASNAPKSLPGEEISIGFAEPESIRPLYVVDKDGNRLMDNVIMYVADSDTVRMKLCIGADINENFSIVSRIYDLAYREDSMLNGLEHDDEGYYCTVDLTKAENCTALMLYANGLDAVGGAMSINLCSDAEKAKSYMAQLSLATASMQSSGEGEDDYYAFADADGNIVFDSDDVNAAMQAVQATEAETTEPETTEPETLSVIISFRDADGNPVPGVMAQICDEATCTVLPSDENGDVIFEGENHSYELHVLMVPDGYQTPEGNLSLPQNGGAMSVLLEAAGE